MKPIIFSLALLSTIFMSFSLAWSDFLPEANGAEFDLEHGEAIAGVLPSPPKIDGNLDDWKYVFQSIEYGIIGMVLDKTLQYVFYRFTVCKYVATEDWNNNLLI